MPKRAVSVACAAALSTFLAAAAVSADGPVLKPGDARGPLPAGPSSPSMSAAPYVSAEMPPPKPASPPLAPLKKVEFLNKALKVMNIAALAAPPPPPQMKVTPAAPLHTGGMKIGYAGPLMFVSPSSVMPDGAYSMTNPPNGKYQVTVEFPSEKDKLYLLDCRFQVVWGGPLTVKVKRGEATQSLSGEDGHYLYTFKSDRVNQSVQMTGDVGAAFYGCELTKLN